MSTPLFHGRMQQMLRGLAKSSLHSRMAEFAGQPLEASRRLEQRLPSGCGPAGVRALVEGLRQELCGGGLELLPESAALQMAGDFLYDEADERYERTRGQRRSVMRVHVRKNPRGNVQVV